MSTQTFSFDVFTASHDAVKAGNTREHRSRVVVTACTHAEAAQLAACMAVIRHGGMPTEVLVRL